MKATELKITTLCENTAGKLNVIAQHGLSLLIEVGGGKLLFDTGQSGFLMDNATHLDMDLTSVRTIILSHGHCDHTGGLESLLKHIGEAEILAVRRRR